MSKSTATDRTNINFICTRRDKARAKIVAQERGCTMTDLFIEAIYKKPFPSHPMVRKMLERLAEYSGIDADTVAECIVIGWLAKYRAQQQVLGKHVYPMPELQMTDKGPMLGIELYDHLVKVYTEEAQRFEKSDRKRTAKPKAKAVKQ